MNKRKKKYPSIYSVGEEYLGTFFIMWFITTMVGKNIIGYFDIFLPFILASAIPYSIHLLFLKHLSYKKNRMIKNILIFIFPTMTIASVYLLTIVTLKPVIKEFTITQTCNPVALNQKYQNDFMSGKNTSSFEVKLNNYTVTWYPNEATFYKYKKSDKIKIEVKKNFLGMYLIVQENKHWRLL